MVDISGFKEEKALYLTVVDVYNSEDKTAVITGEAVIADFKSKAGNAFKKLVIPVSFNGGKYLLGVYADVGQRIGLSYGLETKSWVGRRLKVVIAGKGNPYLTVEVVD